MAHRAEFRSGGHAVSRPKPKNDLLRRARLQMPSPSGAPRPMSRQELAEAVAQYLFGRTSREFGIDANYIGKLERGEFRWPNADYREALRVVLHVATNADLGFYSLWGADKSTYSTQHQYPAGVDRTPAPPRLAAAPSGAWPAEVTNDDRSPLRNIAHLEIETPVPTMVGWSDVNHVRYITRALALSENTYGGGFSGQAAAAQLRYSARMIHAQAADEVRCAVLEAVGNLGGVVGFSAFDIAAYRSARHCFDFSLWCAEQARSWSLRANTLGDLARLAMYVGDINEALSLVEFALVRSDLISATARAMLTTVRARLLALQGRYPEAAAEVGRADEYFAARDPHDDPPWISYYDEAEHQGSTGRALIPAAVDNRDLRRVVPRLQAAVRLHDEHHPRSRAFSRTRLASLLMKVGDPREAATIGRAVLVEASSLRSTRLRSEIEQLGTLATRHQKIPEVSELRHDIEVAPCQIGME